jgi:hypothetical protein
MSNDVLVEVKSTYDATGTQAADKGLKALGETTKEVGTKTALTEKETQKARQALGGLSAAAAASQGSFGGFAMALQNLGGGLADVAAKFALVAGSFSAGYGIGSAIDKWLGLSDAISKAIVPAEQFTGIQDKIRKRLGDLQGASLKAVAAEFDNLSKSVAGSLAELQKMQAIANELRGKQAEAETSELEASMPPGPERDRAILLKKRQTEAEDIATRKAQAQEKYQVAADALAKGKSAAGEAETAAQWAEGDEFKLSRQPGATLQQKVEARLRREAAANAAAAARKRVAGLEDAEGMAFMEKTNTMRGLGFEGRSSIARYQGGLAGIDRDQYDADNAAREAAQGRAGGAATAAQRRYQMEQRNALTQRQAQLQNRQSEIESALPGARVDDLRSAAAAGDKARGAANAAVASMMKALQDVTSQLEAVNDKLNNLPR